MKKILKLSAIALITAFVCISCKKETYIVTLNANGGLLNGEFTELTFEVEEGDLLPHSRYHATHPEGREFTGWYRDVELTVSWDEYADVVMSSMTLYAKWTLAVRCTYYFNGGMFPGIGDRETMIDYVHEGDILSPPSNAIKPGYILEGWYSDETLTEKWDFSTDIIPGDMALYAKWVTGIEGLTRENYPRVDGATSTRALNVMVACKLLGLQYYWGWINETKEMYVYPDGEYHSAESFIDGRIKTSQTYGAMMNLISGQTDIILRSTTASPDEKAAARDAGVTLIETPIALDAFVFLKNSKNTVKSLTIEQIQKIYTKQITNWSQVGGNKSHVKAYTRPRNSGSEEAFRDLVMKDLDPAKFPEESNVIGTMSWLIWAIQQEPNAIGYIFKNYKEKIMNRYYEPVFAINGIYPDATTMRNRTYPFTTEVYVIIRSDLDQNSMAYKLYEWLQSEPAKVVLQECGFVPY